MELLNYLNIIYERFSVYTLVYMRIAAMLWSFNLFRREQVTGRVIFALGSILALFVLVMEPVKIPIYDIFSLKMLMSGAFQVFIGFIAGLILNIVFDIFLGVGQIISTQVGLSMASLMDPRLGNITTLAHFYLIAAALIFLFLNGHLFMIETIIKSFTVVPVSLQFFPQNLLYDTLKHSAVIFSGSIMLSITITMTMLITNISLAVMTRFAPQFNIFSVGININLIMGLFCLYATFNMMTGEGRDIMQSTFYFFQHVLMRM